MSSFGVQGPSILGLTFRYLPRILHVLRTEGATVLLRKLKRRLRTTPLAIKGPPTLLTFDEPFSPVSMPSADAPIASIVIPVYGQFHYTHHCLAALAQTGARLPFEVIVVDDCSPDDTGDRLALYPGLRLIRNPKNLGFVGSCNAGARIARGRIIVFLNNDTQAQAEWLDALIWTFEEIADAGIVGSRLIYPDGRQQEAGGILFSDGSAWNYGHLDAPLKPEYSYLRAVDYCSGAALAIRSELFRQLGGFDEHFAPAYYEDTDLAFRAREAGYGVYYQPTSTVVHFEGVSAGRNEDAATGLKRYQRLNAEKFRNRWHSQLASFGRRGEDLERIKERGVSRRVLVVDNYMVTPDRESGSLRMLNLFRILQTMGYKVTFAAANLEAPQPYVSNLQRMGVEVLYMPYVRSFDSYLAEHGALFDLTILSRADAAAQTMAIVRRRCPRARVIFDTVDLHFLREQRFAELRDDRVIRGIAARRKDQELALMREADLTLVVSDAERELLHREAPDIAVEVVSNIHQIPGSTTPASERHDVLFIGAFAHPPNRDAVAFLCQEIMPLVREVLPHTKLKVIGSNPPPDIKACAGPGVEILGYVANVEPYFSDSRLSVAPLRYGAGVKGKVNQSLAYGLPVVATSVAVEGMYLVDEESVLVADDAPAFAAAILRLLTDDALWQRLSAAGLGVMEDHFSFAAAEQALRRALARVEGK